MVTPNSLCLSKTSKAIIALHIQLGDVFSSLKNRLYPGGAVATGIHAPFSEPSYAICIVCRRYFPDIFMDWFQVMIRIWRSYSSKWYPAIVLFGNNPGFKVYSYSSQSLQLQDFARRIFL